MKKERNQNPPQVTPGQRLLAGRYKQVLLMRRYIHTKHILMICCFFLFACNVFCQEKPYYISKPEIYKKYKFVNAVLIMAEKDSLIGPFTTKFINQFSQEFNLHGINTHVIFKTPEDEEGLIPGQYDSIMRDFNPNGILLLILQKGVYYKHALSSYIEPALSFLFQYSYRVNDEENFIHMYLGKIAVPISKMKIAGVLVSNKLIKKLKRKKIIEK